MLQQYTRQDDKVHTWYLGFKIGYTYFVFILTMNIQNHCYDDWGLNSYVFEGKIIIKKEEKN
jgi:hypothetical protein